MDKTAVKLCQSRCDQVREDDLALSFTNLTFFFWQKARIVYQSLASNSKSFLSYKWCDAFRLRMMSLRAASVSLARFDSYLVPSIFGCSLPTAMSISRSEIFRKKRKKERSWKTHGRSWKVNGRSCEVCGGHGRSVRGPERSVGGHGRSVSGPGRSVGG